MGNDTTLEVVGMGNLEVTMIMGDKNVNNIFKDIVLYIPKITKNLSFVNKGISLITSSSFVRTCASSRMIRRSYGLICKRNCFAN
jgi:hypothetical protein